MSDSLEGGFTSPSVEAAVAFRSALTALSRPGSVVEIAGAAPPRPLSPAAGALALTLCDHETGVWLAPSVDTDAVRDWLAFHTGAPRTDRSAARFALGTWQELVPLSDFAVGSPSWPDRSATLVVEVAEMGRAHRLTGPGIDGEARLTVPDPQAIRANAALFPLGLDFFLTCGSRLAGLPRTTQVEI